MFEIFLEMKWLFVVGCILPAFSNAITCVHRKDIDKGIFKGTLHFNINLGSKVSPDPP